MKSPAFQFYAADFLIGVMGMSDEEVGVYIKMLAFQWERGSLPNDRKTIKKLINSKKVPSEMVLSKFITDDAGFLLNPRLEKERAKQENFRESRASNARKRWEKGDGDDARASAVHGGSTSETHALQSSSSSSEREREKRARSTAAPAKPDFDEDEFEDSMPQVNAKDMRQIQARINSMHPSWRPHFSRIELDELQANRRVLADLDSEDWTRLGAYMDAAIPDDWKAYQPDSRSRFVRDISDVLTHADKWLRRCKKEGLPTGIPETIPTFERQSA
jgi:uncharacterized protein YdaU (DUF1376 family)